MVELLEGCTLFREVPEPVVLARVDIAALLGPESITKKVGRLEMSETERQHVAARKTLRSFAVAIGAVGKGASYRMKGSPLVEAIEKVTDDNGNPVYPNISELTDEQIKEIMAGLSQEVPAAKPSPTSEDVAEPEAAPKEEEEEAPKPARKPRRTRKPRKPKVEEPAPETGAAQEEAPPVATPRRRPSRKIRSAPKAGNELGLLTEMVKSIGVMAEATQDSLMTTNTGLGMAHEKINAIENFLVWFYNTEFADGEEIKSLSEVKWV